MRSGGKTTSPSLGLSKKNQQPKILVPKQDIVKMSKRNITQHAPKIGEGLGVAIAPRPSNRKKIANLSSMVLRTRPDDEEEDQVYPTYEDPSTKQGLYGMSSGRNKSLIDKRNYRQVEHANTFV